MRSRALVVVVSVILFFGPAFAYLAGERGRPIENRSPTGFSELHVGWDGLSVLGAFISDRIPLRQRAVRVDSWIDRRLFHEDPAFGGGSSPRVALGDGGFLFLTDDAELACNAPLQPEEIISRLDAYADAVLESGRRFVIAIAPNKSTLLDDLVPSTMLAKDCWNRYRNEFWGRFADAPPSGYVDILQPLIRERGSTRQDLFLRKDTHWDSSGSIVAVETVVNALAPDVWDSNAVKFRGMSTYAGDLTFILGAPEEDEAPNYVVERTEVRAGVTEDFAPSNTVQIYRHYTNQSDGAPFVPGRTLLITDSFGVAPLNQIIPWFEDLTIVHVDARDPLSIVALIEKSDTVWLMFVERSASVYANFYFGEQAPLDALRTIAPRKAEG